MTTSHTPLKPVAKIHAKTSLVEPEAELSGESHRAWYVSLLVAGLLLLGGTAAFAYHRTIPTWEQHIFHTINGVNAPGWLSTQVAKQLSNAVWGLVAVPVLALLVPRLRRRAWQYVVAMGGTFVLQYILEQVINRPRPALLLHNVVLRAQQGGPGFPSGHEAALTAFALTMWFYVSWPWRIVLAMLVVAEGWARIFLGVHGPLDIVGGVACAMIVVATVRVLAPASWRTFFKLD